VRSIGRTRERTFHYVNCGHNPALLFQPKTDPVTRMTSSCPPIGILPRELCEISLADLSPGDVLVFYTDGVTEAENRFSEEFGIRRLSAVVRRGSSRSAEELINDIFNSASDFCGEVGFEDDVTILVVNAILTAPQARLRAYFSEKRASR
jgi:phosphoserine phosphatase RsbU/P